MKYFREVGMVFDIVEQDYRKTRIEWLQSGVDKLKEMKAQGADVGRIAEVIGLDRERVQKKISSLNITIAAPSFWSQERVDLLTKLWAEGLSASQIAVRLGCKSRSAVIGKVHRLGLSGRATTSRIASGKRAARAASKAPRTAKPVGNPIIRALMAEPFTPSVEELDIPINERKTMETLEECSCRWPIGDPQHADFHFCGKSKVTGLPYCEFHARRAFQPPQPRKRHVPKPDPIAKFRPQWQPTVSYQPLRFNSVEPVS